MKFDFTDFFKYWSVQIIKSYRNLLTQKKGVQYDKAPSNEPSVQDRKGKDHWMVDTKELYGEGFKSHFTKDKLRVYASKERHSGRYTYMGVPGGHKGQKPYVRRARTERRIKQRRGEQPTYEQLFMWHNKKGYSGIFGRLAKDSKFVKEFSREANKQIKTQLPKEMRKRINVKL
ncbi:MAG: hypothetical protein U5N26_06945 [Candidatus Marinimicrobia bacterium]|nr:hypothetical protein [Candidatus Neomarinimicrobiota bacterium]